MKMRNLIFFFIIMFSSISTNYFAQNKTAYTFTSDSVVVNSINLLKQKILLSNKQSSEIKGIVNNFIQIDSNLNDMGKLLDKIYPLLDIRQKAKFDIISNDWLNGLKKDLTEQVRLK